MQTEQTGGRGQTAWSEINWTTTEAIVKRLQDRIYRAAAAGNGQRVKNLQKLLVRSTSAKRLAVRRITQQNAGRNTPGIDGVVCGTPESRMRLANDLSLKDYHPQPVRRVYIPKTDGRRRPLGIPTIRDRALQMLVKMALEPEWESCFEANSYGFRPGRCTMDAIVALHALLAPAGASEWVLDADISSCFDHACWYPLQQPVGMGNWRFWISPAHSRRKPSSVSDVSGKRYSLVAGSRLTAMVPLWMRS